VLDGPRKLANGARRHVLLHTREDRYTPMRERLDNSIQERRRSKRAPGNDDGAREMTSIELGRERVDDVRAGSNTLQPGELKLERIQKAPSSTTWRSRASDSSRCCRSAS
jgi:hypothetical protein